MRRLVLLILALMGCFCLYLFIAWFLMGTITVNVPEGASVAVNKSGLKGERVTSSNTPGEQTFRLKKGDYTIVLTKDFSASKAAVSLGLREQETVTLTLTDPADLYELSRANSNSVGLVDSSPAYADSTLGDIRDNNGSPVGRSENYLARTVVFADDGKSQLLMENDGSTYVLRGDQTFAIFNEGGDDEDGPAFSITSFGALVAAAYDATSDRYCVLSADSRLGWVTANSGTLSEAGTLEEDVSADYIDCHNNVIAYARLNQDYDAETKSKERTIKVHALVNNKTVQLADGEITAFQLRNDSFVFVEKGIVKERPLSDKKIRVIFSTDNTAPTALLANGDQLYVIDTAEIWQFGSDLSSASRRVASPNLVGISDVAAISDGNLILSVARGTSTGVFVTSNNPKIRETKASLALKLPYSTASFSVTQRFNGQRFVLDVTNLAPIPSNGSMAQYDAANQAARTYIASLSIDPAMIEVNYE